MSLLSAALTPAFLPAAFIFELYQRALTAGLETTVDLVFMVVSAD